MHVGRTRRFGDTVPGPAFLQAQQQAARALCCLLLDWHPSLEGSFPRFRDLATPQAKRPRLLAGGSLGIRLCLELRATIASAESAPTSGTGPAHPLSTVLSRIVSWRQKVYRTKQRKRSCYARAAVRGRGRARKKESLRRDWGSGRRHSEVP